MNRWIVLWSQGVVGLVVSEEEENVGFGFSGRGGSREKNEGKTKTRYPARVKKIESHGQQPNWEIDFVEDLFLGKGRRRVEFFTGLLGVFTGAEI